jgi:pre-mRNA-splicing factor CWC22
MYVPPHKRTRFDEIPDVSTVTITLLLNQITPRNIESLAIEFFCVNLIRNAVFLVDSLIDLLLLEESKSPLIPALISLATVINSRVPEIGRLLCCKLISKKLDTKDPDISSKLGVIFAWLEKFKLLNPSSNYQLFSSCMETGDLNFIISFLEFHPKNEASSLLSDFLRRSLMRIKSKNKFLFFRLEKIVKGDIDPKISEIPEYLDLVETEDCVTHEISVADLSEDDLQVKETVSDSEWKEISDSILNTAADLDEDEKVNEKQEEPQGDVYPKISEKTESLIIKHEPSPAPSSLSKKEEESSVSESMAETNKILENRKRIYLTLQSSLTHDECVHKLLQLNVTDFRILAQTIADAAMHEKQFKPFYSLVSERLIRIRAIFKSIFTSIFQDFFESSHEMETVKLKNIASFYSLLVSSKSLDLGKLLRNAQVRITIEDTTSASRILLKFLFVEINESMGSAMLEKELETSETVPGNNCSLDELKFYVNFFIAIGLPDVVKKVKQRLLDRMRVAAGR